MFIIVCSILNLKNQLVIWAYLTFACISAVLAQTYKKAREIFVVTSRWVIYPY